MLKNRIKQLLEDRQITAYRFIKDTGIGETTGYGLARNPNRLPSIAIIAKICDTYKIQPSEIIYWELNK